MWSEAHRPRASSTLFTKVKVSSSSPAPHKEASSFKYRSDGNGRDFYISHNSGGLQAPYIPGTLKADEKFIASLRDTQKRNKIIRFASPKEIQRMRKNFVNQKILVNRLTSNNKDWKDISKQYKSAFLKKRVKQMSIVANNSYAYGLDTLHSNKSSFTKISLNWGLQERSSTTKNRSQSVIKILKNNQSSNKMISLNARESNFNGMDSFLI